MTRVPTFVDYLYPNAHAFRATPSMPLAPVATPAEMRATRVTDPVLGDATTCLDLAQRDIDCWSNLASKFPPRYAFRLDATQRQQSAAARAVCRRRAVPLLQVCRVGGVRVG